MAPPSASAPGVSCRSPSASAAGERHRRLSGPRRRPRGHRVRAAVRAAFAGASRSRASRPSPRRRWRVRSSSACFRSRAPSPGRSPRPTTSSRRRRSRSGARPSSGFATCLLGVERAPLERIQVVRSHPAALDQCRRLLATMPWATAIATGSTAEAAAEVAERGNPEEAAIAGERAAAVYGLSVIAEDVGDHRGDVHQVRLGRDPHAARLRGPGLADGVLVRNRSPARRAPPRDRAVLVARNRSRPARLPAHPRHPVALLLPRGARRPPARPADPGALAEIRSRTRRLKVFGSYPARGGDV